MFSSILIYIYCDGHIAAASIYWETSSGELLPGSRWEKKKKKKKNESRFADLCELEGGTIKFETAQLNRDQRWTVEKENAGSAVGKKRYDHVRKK